MDKTMCVVLGGSGFLGQRLCKVLLELGFQVHSISRSGRPIENQEPWCGRVQWNVSELGSELSRQLIKSAQFVFHLASTTIPSTSNQDMAKDMRDNALGTLQLLQSSMPLPGKFIFVSSGGTVYGVSLQTPIPETHTTEPTCSYGIHKLTIEKYLQLFRTMNQLDCIVLRVSNMYGESQDSRKPIGAISHFVDSAMANSPITIWGDGSIVRDYIHVDDVVKALVASMTYRGRESVFNIGTGIGTSLNQIVEILRAKLGAAIAVRYEPARGFDVPENILGITRAGRELRWSPLISVRAGIDRMIQTWKPKTQ